MDYTNERFLKKIEQYIKQTDSKNCDSRASNELKEIYEKYKTLIRNQTVSNTESTAFELKELRDAACILLNDHSASTAELNDSCFMKPDAAFLSEVNIFFEDVREKLSQKENWLKNSKRIGDWEYRFNEYCTKEYRKILKMNIATDRDLEYAEWLFNNGDLRAEQEKNQRTKTLNDIDYVLSGGLQRDCAKRTYSLSIAMFFIGFGLILLLIRRVATSWAETFIIGGILGLIIGGLLGLIGSVVAHAQNASKAKSIDLPEAERIAMTEKIKMGVSIGAASIAAAAISRHAYKAGKDVANVDGWKEMK